MEIFKRKENYVNPVNTAKRNFIALGVLYAIASIMLFSLERSLAGTILVIATVHMFVIAYLLKRNNIMGAYLGWIFVILGLISLIVSALRMGLDMTSIIGLILTIYIAYWNQKALLALKKSTTETPTTPTTPTIN